MHNHIGIYSLLISCGLTLCVFASCHKDNGKDELAHHHHDHGVHEKEHEGHDHGDGQEIIFTPEQAKLLGVKTEVVKPVAFHSIIKVSGEITESAHGAAVASAPASGVVTFAPGIAEGAHVGAGTLIATVKSTGITGGDANAAARVAVDAAKKEVERLKPLHEHGIVSTAEYNAAVAALNQARASYSPAASSGRITAPSAGIITALDVRQGQYVEAGAPVANISSSSMLNLRADLPQRHLGAVSSLTGAKIKTPYSNEVIDLSSMGAKRIAEADVARANGGYIPVYFSFSNNGTLLPGTAVEVFLEGAPKENAIVVPLTAISEQQGNYYVYIQLDEEGYLKSPVTLGENNGQDVEILKGLHAGDKVVVKGATNVRLAETSNVVPEGHSHNH
ncbi:MAG: efflux RND transporter periplasmic adaptor subunit [Bacteroidales bacterium]|nr:efflux RND transporter periplasmic adaptor subunit [Bacteroidales bacterium]